MDDVLTTLQERIDKVEERIRAACARAGRSRDEVTLVAVTKTVSPHIAALLPRLGVLDLGENRPQELWRKAATSREGVRWHLIGHLQRNKVERTLPLTHLIHSVDSKRLLDDLEVKAEKQGRVVDVLLEVNMSREPNKHGMDPEAVAKILEGLHETERVRVRGLMTMAALTDDPEKARPTFAALRELRDRLHQEYTPLHELRELSMGMTSDFEVAVEEGATLVRIGTALFEGLS